MRRRFGPTGGALAVLLFLALVSGLVAATSAAFNATVGKTGTLAATALAVPAASGGPGTFTAAASANNVVLAWANLVPPVPASPDPGTTGFAVFRAQSANGIDCSTTTFPAVPLTTLAAAATTFTDTNVTATFTSATRVCYQLATGWTPTGQPGPTWFSGNSGLQTNPTASAQVGLFATAVDFGNGQATNPACIPPGCAMDVLDAIKITFNQPTNASATVPTGVCAVAATSRIYLGSTLAGGVCPTTGALGILSGGALALGGADNSWTGPGYSWNNAFGCNVGGTANTVLCIYLFSNGAPTAAPAMSGTWQLTMGSGSTITTAAGALAVCSGAVAGCQPSAPANHNL